jgi:hypothetical protein
MKFGKISIFRKSAEKIEVTLRITTVLHEGKKGKVHPCTGTEALYRP